MSEFRTAFDTEDRGNGHEPKRDNRITREEYWWAWATNPITGGLILLGWNSTENDMQQEAFEKFSKLGIADFEVIPLRTRDRRYAKDLCNAKRIDKGVKIENLIKRSQYKV